MSCRWKGPWIRCLALRAAARMAIQVRERHRKDGDPFGRPDAGGPMPTLRLHFTACAVESRWPADDCFNAILDQREATGRWPWSA